MRARSDDLRVVSVSVAAPFDGAAMRAASLGRTAPSDTGNVHASDVNSCSLPRQRLVGGQRSFRRYRRPGLVVLPPVAARDHRGAWMVARRGLSTAVVVGLVNECNHVSLRLPARVVAMDGQVRRGKGNHATPVSRRTNVRVLVRLQTNG
jgi:hypothetical protein